MQIQRCHAYLSSHLSPERLQHSLGVMQVMEDLAPVYGLDWAAARIAGLVHDAGKELSPDHMQTIARKMEFLPRDSAEADPLYLHGPCSAFIAKQELGIEDLLVLEAIYRHSYVGTGPVRSPVFCWCLRFADMLEPGRDWTEARERLHPLVFSGQLGRAALALMDWMVPFLESLAVGPSPAQRALQGSLAQLHAPGKQVVENECVPV